MADKIIANKQDLVSIADALRSKMGVSTTYNVPQLADATIAALENSGGGVNLPDLDSPATADEIFAGKEAIDENGNVLSGSFSLNTEITTLETHIAELETALEGKAAGGGGKKTVTITVNNQTGYAISYLDEELLSKTVSAYQSKTIEAYNGVMHWSMLFTVTATGNYISMRSNVYMFLEDGGTIILTEEASG